jgi:hypothetical protein
LDIGVLGYIGIVWPKEHSPEVSHIPPGTPCIYTLICMCYMHYVQPTNSMKQSSSWKAMFLSYSRKSLYFMENEDSLPCPHEPAIYPWPEQDQSSQCPPILFTEIHSNISLQSTDNNMKNLLKEFHSQPRLGCPYIVTLLYDELVM